MESNRRLNAVEVDDRPNLMNLRCFAKLPTSGSNLNHRYKVKDKGRV